MTRDEELACLDREMDSNMKSALYMGPKFQAIAVAWFEKNNPAYLAEWRRGREMIERAYQERAKNPNPCPGCPQNCPGYTCLRTRFEVPVWMSIYNASNYS